MNINAWLNQLKLEVAPAPDIAIAVQTPSAATVESRDKQRGSEARTYTISAKMWPQVLALECIVEELPCAVKNSGRKEN